jgi:hypothetical protein
MDVISTEMSYVCICLLIVGAFEMVQGVRFSARESSLFEHGGRRTLMPTQSYLCW